MELLPISYGDSKNQMIGGAPGGNAENVVQQDISCCRADRHVVNRFGRCIGCNVTKNIDDDIERVVIPGSNVGSMHFSLMMAAVSCSVDPSVQVARRRLTMVAQGRLLGSIVLARILPAFRCCHRDLV